MGIPEFQDGEKAKITRLEYREKAFNLGEAAVTAARQKGLIEVLTADDYRGQALEWVQTPFVASKPNGIKVEVAARRRSTSHTRAVYLIVRTDDHNTGIYAKVGFDEGQIEYGVPESEEDLEAADRQVIAAFREIATEMGVNAYDHKFDARPAVIPERPF